MLCLECPPSILFGIDYSAWTVGPKFMGVKLIPPGLHFIYCSPSAEEVGAMRSGFFLFMRPRDVAVLRWDPETEELVRLANAEEEARYADGVRGFDFDANLGPYPLELGSQWQELTRHATPDLVDKIEPISKAIRAKRAEYDERRAERVAPVPETSDELQGDDEGNRMETSDCTVDADQPHQQSQTEVQLESNLGSGNLFFSALPRCRKLQGSSPTETTLLHMDRSAQLDEMIGKEYDGKELGIIGELQLAYIAFLLGQNYDGFEQWKALLNFICSCETAVTSRPELFAELLRAFFAQLSQAPEDLFGEDLTRENFLGSCALSLLELCDSETSSQKLRKRCGKLRELVQQKFGISTEDLAFLGEDAPQVVDVQGRDLIDLAGPGLGDLD